MQWCSYSLLKFNCQWEMKMGGGGGGVWCLMPLSTIFPKYRGMIWKWQLIMNKHPKTKSLTKVIGTETWVYTQTFNKTGCISETLQRTLQRGYVIWVDQRCYFVYTGEYIIHKSNCQLLKSASVINCELMWLVAMEACIW